MCPISHPNPASNCQFLLLAIALFLIGLHPAEAEPSDPASRFDHANKLYEQRKFSEAITAYQLLAKDGFHSAALFFNLGNAYFRNGQTGQAIASYRMAQRLAPRDPDIRANLRFARDSVGGTLPRTRWQRWLNLLTLQEVTLAAVAALWLWFALLAVRQLRRDWIRSFRPYIWASGLVAALGVTWLALITHDRFGQASAVVVVQQSPVRYGPFEESQSAFTLKDGAELSVLNRKDKWLQISDASRRVGWLEAEDVVVLPQG